MYIRKIYALLPSSRFLKKKILLFIHDFDKYL